MVVQRRLRRRRVGEMVGHGHELVGGRRGGRRGGGGHVAGRLGLALLLALLVVLHVGATPKKPLYSVPSAPTVNVPRPAMPPCTKQPS